MVILVWPKSRDLLPSLTLCLLHFSSETFTRKLLSYVPEIDIATGELLQLLLFEKTGLIHTMDR